MKEGNRTSQEGEGEFPGGEWNGQFRDDFEWHEGVGDLDECNGRTGVTPEFPEGIYYYVVTDEFPYFTRCLKGEIDNGGGGGGVPYCEDVPPGNPCCGDGICGGPETEHNCPQDCVSENSAPMLNNFSIQADTVNTSQDLVNVVYEIDVEDSDSFLSSYALRLILNGGPINGGEIIQSSGSFDQGLMSSSVTDVIEIPMGSTEGHWNIRIILRDDLDAVANIGPNDLENQDFPTFLPLQKLTRRKGTAFETQLRPLFPGYMFVAQDPTAGRWRKINHTRGVARLVRLAAEPTPVPATIMDQFL